jgi:hypothetical protein
MKMLPFIRSFHARKPPGTRTSASGWLVEFRRRCARAIGAFRFTTRKR